MTPREHEYEVLKRHDVYVVRKVGSEVYAVRHYACSMGDCVSWWGTGSAKDACEFRFRWRAILHARSLERSDKRRDRSQRDIEARKSATEERVWR